MLKKTPSKLRGATLRILKYKIFHFHFILFVISSTFRLNSLITRTFGILYHSTLYFIFFYQIYAVVLYWSFILKTGSRINDRKMIDFCSLTGAGEGIYTDPVQHRWSMLVALRRGTEQLNLTFL